MSYIIRAPASSDVAPYSNHFVRPSVNTFMSRNNSKNLQPAKFIFGTQLEVEIRKMPIVFRDHRSMVKVTVQ